MKANANTVIEDGDLVLVPYRREHVAKYHEWMLSPELRELTASEPLSLEEEYEMQRKWQEDEDKLTFIVCIRDTTSGASVSRSFDPANLQMIGDVNLFLKGVPADEDFEAEVEIMIAEPDFRGKGYAARALQMMLSYATSPSSPAPLPVPPDRLVARIGESNESSIRLFKKLGFEITKRVTVFQEVEMRFRGSMESWNAGGVGAYS
ncbi:acyl-CoA N-acyltransferase [Panus rudis PR-1116 ss-1]|nr:acyl-CoA N-acyltransferase [Panus rudis PR-1116 ss-1]